MIARAYIFPVCAPGASEGLVFVSAVTQVESVAPHAPAVGPGVEPPLPGCHSHPVTLTALPSLRRAVNFTLEPDRKSTRLNSSHLVISYAVFCLKKKKL